MIALAHVPGDDDEDRREDGHRNLRRQRREREHAQQNGDRVNHSRQRRAPAVLHVHRRSRDRAGGGNSAETCGCDIADALRHQFEIALVPSADHAVGDDAAEQAFDRREHGDGRRFGHERAHARIGERVKQPRRRMR